MPGIHAARRSRAYRFIG